MAAPGQNPVPVVQAPPVPLVEPTLNEEFIKALDKGFHIEILYRNRLSQSQWEPKATLTSAGLAAENVHKVLLTEVRSKAGPSVEEKWSFCLDNEAEVQNEHTLGYYLSLVASNVKKVMQLPDRPPPKGVAQLGKQDLPSSYMMPTLTVLMSAVVSFTPTPPEPSSAGRDMQLEWLKENRPDLKFSTVADVKALEAPKDHKADYIAMEAWNADDAYVVSKPGLLDCVIDMTMLDWRRIMLLNKLVYGSEIRGVRRENTSVHTTSSSTSLDVVNARVAAFSLSSGSPAKGLQLPEFVEVVDSPNIRITEIKSDLQSSLAKSAFSARSIEVMTGGGTPMISAAVSAGVAVESESSTGHLSGQKRTEYFATYNFPRVKLFLDEYTLNVSDDCKKALEKLRVTKTIEALLLFQRRFGTIFATEVVLGGRLEASKYAKSEFVTDNEKEKDKLKASVGANFSLPQFALGSKVSSEDQSGNEKGELDLSSEAMLSWTAKGGNTILCANPPKWAASVATFRNWRTIQQDEVVPLQTLLGRFEGFEYVPQLFTDILAEYNKGSTRPPVPLPALTKEWSPDSKIRLLLQDSAIQCNADNQAQLADYGLYLAPNSLISVRDGEPTNQGGRMMSGLRADYPLAFFFGDAKESLGDKYNSSFVDDTTGKWTKESNNSGKKRFSLRAWDAGDKPWKPLPASYLKSGDKVKLYYHGFDSDLFKVTSPPAKNQYPAMFNSQKREFKFPTKQQALSGVEGYTEAVFYLMFEG